MIVKRKKGYYVVSKKKPHKNLGGPYGSRKSALKRLRAVEYFKHLKKSLAKTIKNPRAYLLKSL